MVGTAWGSRAVRGGYFILFCGHDCFACVYVCTCVYHIHAGAFRSQKKVSDTLEQMVVKHHVCVDLCRSEDSCGRAGLLLPFGAGDQTQVARLEWQVPSHWSLCFHDYSSLLPFILCRFILTYL